MRLRQVIVNLNVDCSLPHKVWKDRAKMGPILAGGVVVQAVRNGAGHANLLAAFAMFFAM